MLGDREIDDLVDGIMAAGQGVKDRPAGTSDVEIDSLVDSMYPGTGDVLKDIPRRVASGFVSATAAIPKGIGAVQKKAAQALPVGIRKPYEFSGDLGIGLGNLIQKAAPETDPRLEHNLVSQGFQALGTSGPALAATLATGGAGFPAAVAASVGGGASVAMEAGFGYDEALARTGDEKKALDAAVLTAPAGLLDVVEMGVGLRVLRRFGKLSTVGRFAGRLEKTLAEIEGLGRIPGGALTAGTEAVQETVQGKWEDLAQDLAGTIKTPEDRRTWSEVASQDGAPAALSGFILDALARSIVGRHAAHPPVAKAGAGEGVAGSQGGALPAAEAPAASTGPARIELPDGPLKAAQEHARAAFESMRPREAGPEPTPDLYEASQAERDRASRSGSRVALFDRGEPSPQVGIYHPETRTMLLDRHATERERAARWQSHEIVHHLEEAHPDVLKEWESTIEAVQPGWLDLYRGAREGVARASIPDTAQGPWSQAAEKRGWDFAAKHPASETAQGPVLSPGIAREEALAGTAEMPTLFELVRDNRPLALKVATYNPGLVQRMFDALRDFMNKIGLAKNKSLSAQVRDVQALIDQSGSDVEKQFGAKAAAQVMLKLAALEEGIRNADAVEQPRSQNLDTNFPSPPVVEDRAVSDEESRWGPPLFTRDGELAVNAQGERPTIGVLRDMLAKTEEGVARNAGGGKQAKRRKKLDRRAQEIRDAIAVLERDERASETKEIGDTVRLPSGETGKVVEVGADTVTVQTTRELDRSKMPTDEDVTLGIRPAKRQTVTETRTVSRSEAKVIERAAPQAQTLPVSHSQLREDNRTNGPDSGNTQPVTISKNELRSDPDAQAVIQMARNAKSGYLGHKGAFVGRFVALLRKLFRNSLKDVETIVDVYSGGGSYGLAYASTGMMPRLKRLILNEFNPHRLARLRLALDSGSDFLNEWNTNPLLVSLREALIPLMKGSASPAQRSLATVLGEKDGSIRPEFLKWQDGVVNGPPRVRAAVVAMLDTMVGGYTADWSRAFERALADANKLKAMASTVRANGVSIELTSLDSRSPEMLQRVRSSGRSLVLSDSPYHETSTGAYSGSGKKEDFSSTQNMKLFAEAARKMASGNVLMFHNSATPEVRAEMNDLFDGNIAVHEWIRSKKANAKAEYLGIYDGQRTSSYDGGRLGDDGSAGASSGAAIGPSVLAQPSRDAERQTDTDAVGYASRARRERASRGELPVRAAPSQPARVETQPATLPVSTPAVPERMPLVATLLLPERAQSIAERQQERLGAAQARSSKPSLPVRPIALTQRAGAPAAQVLVGDTVSYTTKDGRVHEGVVTEATGFGNVQRVRVKGLARPVNMDDVTLVKRAGRVTPEQAVRREEAKEERRLPIQPRFAQRDVTDTPAFRAWFGDSKVVDEDGKPLVVYHGTSVPNTFTSFNRPKGKKEIGGIYFSPHQEHAESYAETTGGGARVMPVYLSIRNPLKVYIDANLITTALVAEWQSYGWDGVFTYARGETEWTARSALEIVAFESNQIKSAIGNRGTFDATNKDIRFATAPQPRKLDSLGFFSRLDEAIDALPDPVKASTALSKLKAQTPAEELEWSHLADILAKNGDTKFSHATLRHFIAMSEIANIEEKQLGGGTKRWNSWRDVEVDLDEEVEGERLYSVADADELGQFIATPMFGGRTGMWSITHQETNEVVRRVDEDDIEERIAKMAFESVAEINKVTQYEGYQLPGGQNYREILLTLPPRLKAFTTKGWRATPNKFLKGAWVVDREDGVRLGEDFFADSEADAIEKARQDFIANNGGKLLGVHEPQFTYGHFDEANVLVHMRVNDRKIDNTTRHYQDFQDIEKRIMQAVPSATHPSQLASGAPFEAVRKGLITNEEAALYSKAKKFNNPELDQYLPKPTKILFVEEIQSDWHQKGLKKGYVGVDSEAPISQSEYERLSALLSSELVRSYVGLEHTSERDRDRVFNDPDGGISKQDQDKIKAWLRWYADTPIESSRVPNAPFKDSWPDLAMKRLLTIAAQEGYDKLAWTTGAQQIDRYNEAMRQNVDKIEVEPRAVTVERTYGIRYSARFDDQHRPWVLTESIDGAPETVVSTFATKDAAIAESESRRRAKREHPVGEGKVYIRAWLQGQEKFGAEVPLEGETTIHGHKVDLEDVVGKEIARKIREKPGERHSFEGEGLAIGGKGMQTFYDKRLRDIAKKLTKNEPHTIEINHYAESNNDPPGFPKGLRSQVHAVDVPAARIKEHGFPRFATRSDSDNSEFFKQQREDIRERMDRIKRGESELDRPLANPTRAKGLRQFAEAVQEMRKEGLTDEQKHTWENAQVEWKALEDKDPEGLSTLRKLLNGDPLNEAEMLQAQRLKEEAARAGLKAGPNSLRAHAEAVALEYHYAQARAAASGILRNVRDRFRTRQERFLAALYGVDSKTLRAARKAATPEERDRILAREVAKVQKALFALRDAGFSPEILTKDYFADDDTYGRMADIAARAKGGFWDWLYAWRASAMQVSTLAWVRNPASNAAHIAFDNVFARALVNTPAETKAYLYDMLEAVPQAIKHGRSSWRWGFREGTSGDEIRKAPGWLGLPILEKAGVNVNAGQDAFFRHIVATAELKALARYESKRTGRPVEDFLANPELLAESEERGKHSVFADRDRITSALQALRGMFDIGGFSPGKMVVPYLATPTQIVRAGLTVAGGPVVPAVRLSLRGMTAEAKRHEVGRLLAGLAVWGAVYGLVNARRDDDLPWITGSRQQGAAGEQQDRIAPAYSVTNPFTGNYISYQNVDPFGTALAMMVDVLQGNRSVPASVASTIKDKSFFRGVQTMYEAVTDDNGGKLGRYTRQTLWEPMIPGVVRQVLPRAEEQATKPIDRTNLEALSARRVAYGATGWPGWAPAPKFDRWGRPVLKAGRSWFARMFDVMPVTREGHEVEQIDLLLESYRDETGDPVSFGAPPRSFERAGQQIDMTEDEYARLTEEAGQRAIGILRPWAATKKALTPRDIDHIRGVISQSEAIVKNMIFKARRSALPIQEARK